MRVLGLINARGGSKGIPRKNIRDLGGKPLIAYAIEAGLAAKLVNRLVVSTDDAEIAQVARDLGADVPFLRPAELATDTVLQIEAIRHALVTLASSGAEFDVVIILQPTSPLRRAQDVDGALALLESSGADTVISVTQVHEHHPLTMYSRSSDGSLTPLFESNPAGTIRQQFPPVWWRNGAVFAMRVPVVMGGSLYGPRVVGYPMPSERSVNIDDPLDWVIAEAMLRHLESEAHA